MIQFQYKQLAFFGEGDMLMALLLGAVLVVSLAVLNNSMNNKLVPVREYRKIR